MTGVFTVTADAAVGYLARQIAVVHPGGTSIHVTFVDVTLSGARISPAD